MTRIPPRTAVVLVFVVAFAAASVLFAVGGIGTPAPERPARPVDPAPAAPTPTVAAPAPDVTWVEFAGVKTPVSATAGPYNLDGGRAQGFARTDLGAALAAVHIAGRASYVVEPSIFRATIREQIVGSDADALLEGVEAGYDQALDAAGRHGDMPKGNATIHGYRVMAGDADTRSVSILYSGPDTRGMTVWVAVRDDLVWRGGDWKVVAPFAGDSSSSATVVGPNAAASYRPFGG